MCGCGRETKCLEPEHGWELDNYARHASMEVREWSSLLEDETMKEIYELTGEEVGAILIEKVVPNYVPADTGMKVYVHIRWNIIHDDALNTDAIDTVSITVRRQESTTK